MRNTMHSQRRGLMGSPVAALTILTAFTLALTLAALPASAEYEGAYSYLRVVDGDATLFQGDTGEREAAATNLPLLTGDRLWVAPGARLEVILSDGNILRLDGDTEVRFERLAYSPEADHPYTELALTEGNLQLVVADEIPGEERLRLTTPNATIYLQKAGSYRLTADRRGFTQLVVREGYAEVVSQRGSTIARSGEEVVVEGTDWPRSAVYRAADLDALELWGEELERAAAAAPEYVDEDLRYAAADLDDYGSWVTVDRRAAWRPHRYEDDWRPYWNGRWRHTPAGLVWVSHEPWGWVPYHYGSWDYHPVYGWVWYPGNRFAPAHVYWYWGSGYVAWYPRGYYDHYYSHHYYGHSDYLFALHGYGGGSWRYFDNWIFCRTDYLGSYRQHRYLEHGHDVRRHTGWHEVPRGVVTTDTGPLGRLDRDEWRDSRRVREVLEKIPTADGRGLRDVTPILERKPELAPELRQVLNNGRLRASPEVLKPTTARRPSDTVGSATDTPRSPAGTTVRRPGGSSGGTVGTPRNPAGTTVRRPGGTSTGTPSTGAVERGTVRDRGKPTTGSDARGGRNNSGVTSRSPTSPRSPGASRGGSGSAGTTGTRNPNATQAPRTPRPSSGTTVRPGSGSTANRRGSAVNRGGSTVRREGSGTSTSKNRGTTTTRRPGTPSASGGSSGSSSNNRSGTVQRGGNRRSPSASSGGSSTTARRPSSASRSNNGRQNKPSSANRSSPRSGSKPSSAGRSSGSRSKPGSASRSTPRSGGKPSSTSRSGGGSGSKPSSASRSRSGSGSKPKSSNSGGGRRGAKPRTQTGGDGR